MKAQKIYTVLFCSLLFSVLSCVREDPVILEEDGLVRVPVSLNLSVDAIIDGTPETKSIIEPEVVNPLSDEAQIKNIVVLQFNGVTSTARLVGGQTYFDHWPLTGDEKLTLVASGTAANTVVVLANTFDRITIASNTTLGQFLEQDYTTIGALSDVLTTSGGNEYFRLSGSQQLVIEGQTTVSIALKRNVAKIVVNVTNNTFNNSGDNKITISKVQLREINAKYYYLAHIGDGISVSFIDSYLEAYPSRFDNVKEDFPAEKNPGGASQGGTQQYVYYVPVNLRGTTTNTQQYSKSLGAPKGATRFCIFGTYGTSNTPINYTYYLGANLTDDFNILPNYKYTYNITINSKGNPNYDYRIEDMGEIKFQTDANCYMLHPPVIEGQSRIYSIPVRRAAVFWNENGDNSGVYGASQMSGYTSYVWDSGTNWTAEVLWSTFDLTPYPDFLHVASGTGFAPGHTQPYIKVKVHPGMKGSVSVAVKVNGTILWSWHLWITDYDPDKNVVPEPGKYIYGVENGEIHRYNNTLWNTQPTATTVGYANGFAMDRNLGALAANVIGYQAAGSYYEFGRKDPFPYGTISGDQDYFYLPGSTERVKVVENFGTTPDQRVITSNSTYLATDSFKNIRYTVLHPMIYIRNSTNGRWTVVGDDLAPTSGSGEWLDKNYLMNDNATHEAKKSIYDPCPPGWKIPVNGTYASFGPLRNAQNEATGEYNLDYIVSDYRIYYYPNQYKEKNNTGVIYFAAAGRRFASAGGVYNYNGFNHYYTSNGALTFGYNPVSWGSSDYPGDHCYGNQIRCVRE